MVWAAVLVAALLTVPASVNIHDKNIALAQAEQERAEFAVMQAEYENANEIWCEPKAEE